MVIVVVTQTICLLFLHQFASLLFCWGYTTICLPLNKIPSTILPPFSMFSHALAVYSWIFYRPSQRRVYSVGYYNHTSAPTEILWGQLPLLLSLFSRLWYTRTLTVNVNVYSRVLSVVPPIMSRYKQSTQQYTGLLWPNQFDPCLTCYLTKPSLFLK